MQYLIKIVIIGYLFYSAFILSRLVWQVDMGRYFNTNLRSRVTSVFKPHGKVERPKVTNTALEPPRPQPLPKLEIPQPPRVEPPKLFRPAAPPQKPAVKSEPPRPVVNPPAPPAEKPFVAKDDAKLEAVEKEFEKAISKAPIPVENKPVETPVELRSAPPPPPAMSSKALQTQLFSFISDHRPGANVQGVEWAEGYRHYALRIMNKNNEAVVHQLVGKIYLPPALKVVSAQVSSEVGCDKIEMSLNTYDPPGLSESHKYVNILSSSVHPFGSFQVHLIVANNPSMPPPAGRSGFVEMHYIVKEGTLIGLTSKQLLSLEFANNLQLKEPADISEKKLVMVPDKPVVLVKKKNL